MNKESLVEYFVHVFERPVIFKELFFILLIILLNIIIFIDGMYYNIYYQKKKQLEVLSWTLENVKINLWPMGNCVFIISFQYSSHLRVLKGWFTWTTPLQTFFHHLKVRWIASNRPLAQSVCMVLIKKTKDKYFDCLNSFLKRNTS